MRAVVFTIGMALAFIGLMGLWWEDGECPDCPHKAEDHGHHCNQDGCCCQFSGEELQ